MDKLCPKCGETKAEAAFYTRPNGNLQSWCIACMKALRVQRNPQIAEYQRRRRAGRTGVERELEKDYQLQYKFGISLQEYNEMLEAQGHCCAICGKADGTDLHAGDRTKQLGVDHDHRTGMVRGLLCNDCNRAIGQLKDSAAVVRKAADYMDRWAEVHTSLPSLGDRLLDELEKEDN
jgi:Autographiviridae endonuclease VII